MTDGSLKLVEEHDYQTLFISELRWSRPDQQPITVSTDEKTFQITNVSSYKGLRVWVCATLPSASEQAFIDRAIAKKSTDRLVIFHDDTKQVWRWPVRKVKAGVVSTRLTSHLHVTGQDNPKLIKRLDAITLGITEDLAATEVIERVRQAFDVETEKETRRASKLMVSMFDALKNAGAPEHDISVTLARILFLMFGDDTDMWEPDLFQDFIINHTRPDGTDLADRLNELFAYLDTRPSARGPVPEHLAKFKYVNGGLFRERISLPPVGSDLRVTILDATSSNWGDISPAIFGSMFQSVRDAATRREFGEHYTSETDILKTLNPLFLNDLRDELSSAITGNRDTRKRLRALRNRIGKIRFLDPACGCGNFILIAYRELRLLEISIVEHLRDLGGGKPVFAKGQMSIVIPGVQMELDEDNQDVVDDPTPVVRLDNFFGIEIDEWPAKIAETAMFLMDRQCDLQMLERLGYAPNRLPIESQATIVTSTADNPDGGNALRIDWANLVTPSEDLLIAGNPPFIGKEQRTATQTSDMQNVWGLQYSGELDYVTSWIIKAARYFGETAGRFAFVSTSSITQGVSVGNLYGALYAEGWDLLFAHRTFPWTSDATGSAAVHCVITGYSRRVPDKRSLYVYDTPRSQPREVLVSNLNGYLVNGPRVLVKERRSTISPSLTSDLMFGSMPADKQHLLVSAEDYQTVADDPIAAKYLKVFVGARELINGTKRWCIWMPTPNWDDINASAELRDRINAVRAFRMSAKDKGVNADAAHPYRFHRVKQRKTDYLCIPAHFSEDRLYATTQRFGPDVIASNANFTVADKDGLLFAVISSGMFMAWQKAVGGRIKSDLRFSSTVVWNNFPMRGITASERSQITAAGAAVLAARANHAGQSLASMYGSKSMPSDLLDAHLRLDAEIDGIFGLAEPPTEERRLEILFDHYVRLTAAR